MTTEGEVIIMKKIVIVIFFIFNLLIISGEEVKAKKPKHLVVNVGKKSVLINHKEIFNRKNLKVAIRKIKTSKKKKNIIIAESDSKSYGNVKINIIVDSEASYIDLCAVCIELVENGVKNISINNHKFFVPQMNDAKKRTKVELKIKMANKAEVIFLNKKKYMKIDELIKAIQKDYKPAEVLFIISPNLDLKFKFIFNAISQLELNKYKFTFISQKECYERRDKLMKLGK